MQMKVVFVLLFLVLGANALEFEWSDDSVGLTKSEQESVLNKYIDLKYPREAKIRREKIARNKKKQIEKLDRERKERDENIVTMNGLMWQDDHTSKTIERDWKDAKKYCSELELGGFSDWFLPNIKQLKSIVGKKEFKNIISSFCWSSSPHVADSYYAWGVYFQRGGYSDNNDKTDSYYVRCARAGQ